MIALAPQAALVSLHGFLRTPTAGLAGRAACPYPWHISTSYVERHNLTMRMGNRRFGRLTNAFSKRLANHVYQVALFVTFYNWVRIHQTLEVNAGHGRGTHAGAVRHRLARGAGRGAGLEAWVAGAVQDGGAEEAEGRRQEAGPRK